MTHASTFVIEPLGRFSLDAAREFAGGFPAGIGARASGSGLLATFPVEGWAGSAAVDVWEADDGSVHGEVHGSTDVGTVRRQVARSLSLDHDGREWEAVGRRDPVLGAVQARFDWLRPVCFYSAYEAATSFVIGQRISMRQGRIVKERLAASLGDEIEVDGTVVRAVPAAGTPSRGDRRARPQLGQGRPPPRPGPGRHRRAPRHGAAARTPRSRRPERADDAPRRRAVDRPGDPDPRLRAIGCAAARRRDQPDGRRRRVRLAGATGRCDLDPDRRGVASLPHVGDRAAPHGLAQGPAGDTQLSTARGTRHPG